MVTACNPKCIACFHLQIEYHTIFKASLICISLQHITYNEWLPIILGTDFMDELDILPITYGYSSRYDKTVNPTIINSFSAAAFRFGHTLIQGSFE